jgi:GT2 family glycosyltransferase
MRWHIAPENDYRGIAHLHPGPEPNVAVVIPVYNRVELLRRTLAGLVGQTYPKDRLEVIVADDGSEEDVTRAVSAFAGQMRVTLVRQKRMGYGAGRARNLGADRTAANVLVFIDADCIPDPELVAAHVHWHRRAENVVVIGSRHHMDSTDISEEELAAGTADLRSRSVGEESAGDALIPDDFRRLFYRRTANLRLGDEAFRSLVSSNFSIRRDRFLAVGGFAEDFNRWGGEDTELGWRLFNSGMFFIPENTAAIYHQIQEDGGDAPDWRKQARQANDGIIQAKIPHRFYRKSERGYIYETPKVSWLIVPTVASRIAEIWDQLLRQSFTDFEVIALGGDPAVDGLGEMLAGDPRLSVIPSEAAPAGQFKAAVAAARGEYIALLHGWASLDHRLLGRAVRRLDGMPRSSIVRCGYQVVGADGSVDYVYDDAIRDLDLAWNEGGMPIFALTRRREWAKLAAAAADPGEWWNGVLSLSDIRSLRDAMVAVPGTEPSDRMPDHFPAITGERTHFIEDVTKGGPRRAAKAIGRYAVSRAARRPYRPVGIDGLIQRSSSTKPETGGPPGVTYVGWLGRDNFGDEAMLKAVRDLLPEAVVSHKAPNRRILMLGGGTLINRMTYLDTLRQFDSPRVERVVFGSGVADPSFWGQTEPTDRWIDFLDTCAYVGVRGPRSEELLREWGFEGELEMLGDPALSIRPPTEVETEDGLLVVSPAWTNGELWGGDDAKVFSAVAAVVDEVRRRGRPVAYLSCFPGDDRHIMEIMKQSGSTDAAYVAGYADHDAAVELLARAEVVLAERLHAAVVAAACGSPFVAIEYRPKIRDFARSVGQDDLVVRSDAVHVEDLIERLDRARASVSGLVSAVAGFRSKQEQVAEKLRRALLE